MQDVPAHQKDRSRPLTVLEESVPTILAVDQTTGEYVIGSEAQRLEEQGLTSALAFKQYLGEGDAAYEERSPRRRRSLWLKDQDQNLRLLSAREAATEFLRKLLSNIEVPGTLVIGEPAILEPAWRDNFRRHVRQILSDLQLGEPQFFHEPFAVYQYYRSRYGIKIQQETVLIVDIGGSTFNSCIIRTTEDGSIAYGSAHSRPLGLRGDFFGGAKIDERLLERAFARLKRDGIASKETIQSRLESDNVRLSVLPRIEQAKIRLSRQLESASNLAEDLSKHSEEVRLPAQTLAAQEIRLELTGNDLRDIVLELWNGEWRRILGETIDEALTKLQTSRKDFRLDRIILAGGSSKLPFMRQNVNRVLREFIDSRTTTPRLDYPEYAVAQGIAVECKALARRYKDVRYNSISQYCLTDLFIGVRRDRGSDYAMPKVRTKGSRQARRGRLLTSPVELASTSLDFEIELPFDPHERLHFGLFKEDPSTGCGPMNVQSEVFKLHHDRRFQRKVGLTLNFSSSSEIELTFSFHGKGAGAKSAHEVRIDPIPIDNIDIVSGHAYFGLDFGHSNCYLTKVLEVDGDDARAGIPELALSRNEEREVARFHEKLREDPPSRDVLVEFARSRITDIVFHSSRIENIPISKSLEVDEIASPDDLGSYGEQARQLRSAYEWMLGNLDLVFDNPIHFARHLHKIFAQGWLDEPGEFRTHAAKPSGSSYSYTLPNLIPATMADTVACLRADEDPLTRACRFHALFEMTHPFADGNGRVGRILLDATLLSEGLPPSIIRESDRSRYLAAMEKANGGQLAPLCSLIRQRVTDSLNEIRHGLRRASTRGPDVVVKNKAGDGIREAFSSSDPFSELLNFIRRSESQATGQAFEATTRSLNDLKAQLWKSIEEAFKEAEKGNVPIEHSLQAFDELTLEAFQDQYNGTRAVDLWWFSLSIRYRHRSVRYLFKLESDQGESSSEHVCVRLYAFDGEALRSLRYDPVSLRLIRLSTEGPVFLNEDGEILDMPTTSVVRYTLAEILGYHLISSEGTSQRTGRVEGKAS